MKTDDPDLTENAPASAVASDDPPAALVDRVMAIAHLQPAAHVAIIGRRTLPLVLALMRRGCDCVRSLRPGAPSPDREAVDLAWIVDVASDEELDEALRVARARLAGSERVSGRVIVEGAVCVRRSGLPGLCDRADAAGLEIVSFDHMAGRLVLAPASGLAMAA